MTSMHYVVCMSLNKSWSIVHKIPKIYTICIGAPVKPVHPNKVPIEATALPIDT